MRFNPVPGISLTAVKTCHTDLCRLYFLGIKIVQIIFFGNASTLTYVCSGVRDHWMHYLRRQANGTGHDLVLVVRCHIVCGAVDNRSRSSVDHSAEQCWRSSVATLTTHSTILNAVNIA